MRLTSRHGLRVNYYDEKDSSMHTRYNVGFALNIPERKVTLDLGKGWGGVGCVSYDIELVAGKVTKATSQVHDNDMGSSPATKFSNSEKVHWLKSIEAMQKDTPWYCLIVHGILAFVKHYLTLVPVTSK